MRIHTPTLPEICHGAKFKTRQFVLGTDSPNLMLAKVSCYTVYVCMYMAILALTMLNVAGNMYASYAQVRQAGAKGNKAQTLYTTDSYVVALAAKYVRRTLQGCIQ